MGSPTTASASATGCLNRSEGYERRPERPLTFLLTRSLCSGMTVLGRKLPSPPAQPLLVEGELASRERDDFFSRFVQRLGVAL